MDMPPSDHRILLLRNFHGRRRKYGGPPPRLRRLPLPLRMLMLILMMRHSSSNSIQAVEQIAPPIYGAYPTGGPVNGGTTVTIVGKEFGRINTVGLDRVRCSWGDPRPWQQAVFASQQAEMDGWSLAESVLPHIPPYYFTGATRVTADVPVTPYLRSTFQLPAAITKVDMLECPSHEREPGDVNLWFSLRYYESVCAPAFPFRQPLAAAAAAAAGPYCQLRPLDTLSDPHLTPCSRLLQWPRRRRRTRPQRDRSPT